MAAAKKKIIAVGELLGLNEPLPKATIHGMLTSLSAIKRGRKARYFEGTISDGIGKARIVGFLTAHQKSLHDFFVKREPVLIEDCEIRRARRGTGMDVVLKNVTKISKSPETFFIPSAEFEEEHPKNIFLNELEDLEQYVHVTVSVKVMAVGEVHYVTTGLKKQDLVVTDRTGTARLTLWETDVDSLKLFQCYQLTNFVVKEFNAKKYLVKARSESQAELLQEPIEGALDSEPQSLDYPDPEADPTLTIYKARIVAVLSLESHKICLRCKARVEPATPPFGRCSQQACSMLQLFDACSELLTAKILFLTPESRMVSLTATGSILQEVMGSTTIEVTERELLMLPEFTEVKYKSSTNAISSITRGGHIETTV